MSRHHALIKNDPRWEPARAECFERDGWACVECGSTEDLQADHVVPLDVLFADGVDDEVLALALDPDSLSTLCKRCNGRKGATITTEPTRNQWVNPHWMDAIGWINDHEPADEAPVL